MFRKKFPVSRHYLKVAFRQKVQNHSPEQKIEISCLLLWVGYFLLQSDLAPFFLRFDKCIVPSEKKATFSSVKER